MRQRTFYYNWCNKTETDYVCSHCETIILNTAAGCQHCRETHDKAVLRIAKLKGTQQSIEMNQPGELALF